MQLARGVSVSLGGPAVEHGFSFQAPPLPCSRLPPDVAVEPLQLLTHPVIHLTAALRELSQHLRIDTDHLGNPIHRLVPFDSEAAGQLGPQPGPVGVGNAEAREIPQPRPAFVVPALPQQHLAAAAATPAPCPRR
mgnify:CR=1 FL=1